MVAPAVPANWASSFKEFSADHLPALPLVATVTRNACSGGAWVAMVLPVIMPLPVSPGANVMSSYFFGFNLLFLSRHQANRDKPFTSPASGMVKDNRT